MYCTLYSILISSGSSPHFLVHISCFEKEKEKLGMDVRWQLICNNVTSRD